MRGAPPVLWHDFVMSRPVGLTSMMAIALLAAACGNGESASGSDGADVEATTWTLVDVAGAPVPDGVEVTLDYDGERISGTGGCNQYSGGATFEDGTVTVETEIMSTLKACEDPAADLERRYFEALPRVAGFAVDDDTLRLTDSDGEPLLTFSASP